MNRMGKTPFVLFNWRQGRILRFLDRRWSGLQRLNPVKFTTYLKRCRPSVFLAVPKGLLKPWF